MRSRLWRKRENTVFDMAVKETTLIFCVFLLGGGGDNYRYYKRNPCSMHIKMDA